MKDEFKKEQIEEWVEQEGAELSPEVVKTNKELELQLSKNKLKLAQLGYDNMEAFEKQKYEFEPRLEDLEKREAAVKEKGEKLDTEQSQFTIDREKMINEQTAGRQALAQATENKRKQWEAEDRKRKEKNLAIVSSLDKQAAILYNALPSDISNRVRAGAVEVLGILMAGFGLIPEFNERNEYVPIRERDWEKEMAKAPEQVPAEIREAKAKRWQPPVVLDAKDLPDNVRKSYDLVKKVYQHCSTDTEGLGNDFCRATNSTLNRIQVEVDSKIDSYLDLEKLKGYFRKIAQQMMHTAELCQNRESQDVSLLDKALGKKTFNYEGWCNWLCQCHIKLCDWLDIGVIADDKNQPFEMK